MFCKYKIKIISVCKVILSIVFIHYNLCDNEILFAINNKRLQPQQSIINLDYNKLFEINFYKYKEINKFEVGNNTYKTLFFIPRTYQSNDKFPVVIYLHGDMHSDFKYYEGFIKHLCQRGWLVIFPLYKYSSEYYTRYLYNTVRGIKEVLNSVLSLKKIQLDINNVSIIAHESSCIIAIDILSNYLELKLPQPRMLMLFSPQNAFNNIVYSKFQNIQINFKKIRSDTFILIVIGENCDIEEYNLAKNLFYSLSSIPLSQKNLIIFRNDFYGFPPVIADKYAFYSPLEQIYEKQIFKERQTYIKIYNDRILKSYLLHRGLDSIDWYGTFRLFDNFIDYIFKGKPVYKEFLGYWSDNVPIKPPIFTSKP